MAYDTPQAQVRWTGRYSRVDGDGKLFWTTSNFSTAVEHGAKAAWGTLAKRESWLPHGPVTPTVGRGGWTLQEISAEPILVLVCSRCGQRGCGGPTNPHE